MHGRQTDPPPTSRREREKRRPQAKKEKHSPKNNQVRAGQKKAVVGSKMPGVVEPQQSREKTAELYFGAGLNCEQAIFAAFADVLGLSLVKAQQEAPLRKDRGAGCGAFRAGLAVLTNILLSRPSGGESPSDAFKDRFMAEFGSLECAPLREKRRDCLDVIGRTARLLDEIITQYKL